ncbi:hypothetical protein J8V57_17885 [Xenorhabdus sp. PB61.4]|uniref:hypothetical protein n=1 Tax=Xenorhabdus sp. PB61.4 TaxID=2788940 RepID=UPI001E4A4779|nr:hypothetical protein [Xenorhabdus sp. PB61.4]MCC8368101.1 hypothetical protein [Xenorhabdus sp. PB61.4]
MAKKPQQELGGLPPELQTDPTDAVNSPDIQSALPEESDNDTQADGQETPEFVVVRGRTVRHNGVDYPENTVIPIFGGEAERLLALGVIVRLDDLRAQLLSRSSQEA